MMNELIGAGIQLASFLLLSLGSMAVVPIARRLSEVLRLQSDEQVRGYLTRALELAVRYGEQEARRRLDAQGLAPGGPLQANMAADLARDYVQKSVPDALGRFGIDTPRLDAMIRARIPLGGQG